MRLNFRRHGAFVALGTLLFSVACGTASQSQTQTDSQSRSNQPAQSEGAVVATIGEREITLADVDEKARAANMAVFQQLYEARRDALGELVAGALLSEEAASRGITEDELVSQEITSKVPPVSESDVQAFFEQNRARIGGQTLEQIGGQIREYMVVRNETQARQSFIDGLRADAGVMINLDPPRVPVTVASNERIKGSEDAAVTIVEYSDFQ